MTYRLYVCVCKVNGGASVLGKGGGGERLSCVLCVCKVNGGVSVLGKG